jgi:aminoglycoside phosphotransferase (APT) family kinase protein
MTVFSADPARSVGAPSVEDVLAPLQEFAELPGWLARTMDPGRFRAELERRVPELADGRLRLAGCAPDRIRAKDGRWVARYELLVADPAADDPAGADPWPLVLTGELSPPTDPAPDPPVPTARFGDPDWAGWLPELRLRLRTETGDEGLPALAGLIDPEAARALLERAIGEQALPGIRITEAVPEVLRYKPGSRCTLRYRLRYDAPRPGRPDSVVVKIHHGEKGANAFAAMRALWATGLARDGGRVTLAQPLAYLPEQRILVQAGLPGESQLTDTIRAALRDGDRRTTADLRAHLRRTARALAALHGCGVRHGRVHTVDDELAEVCGLIDRLGAAVPALATAADPLLARLRRLAAAAPVGPLGLVHADFRPGQVLVHGTEIGFIDFDGCLTAEPALDVGRFRAKLRDIGIFAKDVEVEPPRGAQLAERLAALDELCEVFLDGYRAHAPVDPARVLLWETTDLLTAVLHAWTKVRFARVTPRLDLLEHQIRRVFDGEAG